MKLLRWRKTEEVERQASLSFNEWLSYFEFNGVSYPFGFQQTLTGNKEEVSGSFTGLIQGAYRSNGVIFACMMVRQLLFSEARFQYRQMTGGRPGKLFGTPALGMLEEPWPGGTTGDMLSRMIQDADLSGNAFIARRGNVLRRMRPDWTAIVIGSQSDEETVAGDLDADLVGYIYQPGGPSSGKKPVTLLAEEVAHFAPIPDPEAWYRGMSWLTPVLREIAADSAATSHKLKFFEMGATPNMIVKLAPEIKQDAFEQWVRLFKEDHEGTANAYKTLFLGGGADATVVGSNMRQLDFKSTQGAGETRIAAAAGVPPVIVGLSEGLEASTYSNYSQARRRFADGTMRPLWRNAAGSLANIISVPSGAQLWYDDRDIPFLQEDEQDAAAIMQTKAAAIRALTDAGYTAESVVDAVMADDLTLLVHSGLFSVQLQPPGTVAAPMGSTNGQAGLPQPATSKGVSQ